MNIWQIKAGDSTRDYSEVFIHYGVMLIGSGEYGDYRKSENKDKYRAPRVSAVLQRGFQRGPCRAKARL